MTGASTLSGLQEKGRASLLKAMGQGDDAKATWPWRELASALCKCRSRERERKRERERLRFFVPLGLIILTWIWDGLGAFLK